MDVSRNRLAEAAQTQRCLDYRVYARAPAWIGGTDRLSEAGWAELERRVSDHEMAPRKATAVKALIWQGRAR